MRPNASQLARRDPALAALMGALPGQDFGVDENFGADTSFEAEADFGNFGGLSPFDVSQNIGGFGFGWDYGADAAAPPPPAAASPAAAAAARATRGTPHPAAMHAAWVSHTRQQAHTSSREMLLDPNQHSTTKVERYSFSITAPLVLNVASAFNITLQPNTKIRPQRVVMNAPTPNFVLLSTLQMANVNVFVGTTEDAFTYSATSQGVMLDLPTLEPANRATLTGNYTGFVPPGFANNFAYTFVASFQGPSTIAGGG
jgi:hypothetical protein